MGEGGKSTHTFFFRCTINIFITHGLTPSLLGEDLGDGLSESGFAMIDMTDGADVHVRFGAVEFIAGGGEGSAGKAVEARRRRRCDGREEKTPCRLVGEGGEGGAAHGRHGQNTAEVR